MIHDETNLAVASNDVIKYNNTNLSNGITYNPITGELQVPTAGSTFRFVNSSAVDFELVPNDKYSAVVSISRIN